MVPPESLGQTSSQRKLWLDIGSTFSTQTASTALGLGASVVLARTLGAHGNGIYSLCLLLPRTVATLLSLGLPAANAYHISRNDFPLRQVLRSNAALWVAVVAAGGATAVLVVFPNASTVLPGVPKPLLWVALSLFPAMLLQDLLASLLQGKQDFFSYNTIALVYPTTILVLAPVTVVLLDLGVLGALIAQAAAVCGALLVAGARLRTVAWPPSPADPTEPQAYARAAIGYGMRCHLGNMLSAINYRVDVYMVNLMLSPEATGIFVVAVLIAERLWLLSHASGLVLFPRISALHGADRGDHDERLALTPLVARWTTLVTTAGALVLAAIGLPAIALLYGTAFVPAYGAILWLLPGIVCGGFTRVLAADLAGRGRPELNLYVVVLVLVLNVVGNWLLIPRFGMQGAAMATGLAFTASGVMTLAIYAAQSNTRWWHCVLVQPSDLLKARQLLAQLRLSDNSAKVDPKRAEPLP